MTRDQRDALLTARRIAEAVIEVVNETPQGAPGGLLYAALMNHMTLDQFESLMRLLVETGKVVKRGDLYFPGVGGGGS